MRLPPLLLPLALLTGSFASPASSLQPRNGGTINRLVYEHVPCPFTTPFCDCVWVPYKTNILKDLVPYCGYVDPDWHLADARKVDPMTGLTNNTVPPPTVPQPGMISAPANPTQLNTTYARVRSPLVEAIRTIGAGNLLMGFQAVILNQLPPENRGKNPQGLWGTVNQTSINFGAETTTFFPGATWVVRWDFSWWQPGGKLPESGIFGPHVEVLMQNTPENGGARRTWGFYFVEGSELETAERNGDLYFENVLADIKAVTRWDDKESHFNAFKRDSAQYLSENWHQKFWDYAPHPKA